LQQWLSWWTVALPEMTYGRIVADIVVLSTNSRQCETARIDTMTAPRWKLTADMLRRPDSFCLEAPMSQGFWPVLVIVVAVVVYVLAKVVFYVRKSREQWQQVDRSKLKEWKDDDEW
jgi:hypothetical protein